VESSWITEEATALEQASASIHVSGFVGFISGSSSSNITDKRRGINM
jgi:hypothetical protein